MFALAAQVAYE